MKCIIPQIRMSYIHILLKNWLSKGTINLFELDLFYIAFVSTTSTHAIATLQRERGCQIHEFTDPNLLFSPWGNSVSASLFQLALVCSSYF